MKRSTAGPVSWVLACSCALFILQGPDADHCAFGQAQNRQSLLKEIYEAFRTREQQLNPVWIKYTLHLAQTGEYFNRRGKTSGESADHKITLEGEFARKGNRTRTWAINHDPDPRVPARETFRIFTGQVMITTLNEPNAYAISEHSDVLMEAESPYGIVGEEMLYVSLQQWMEGKKQIEVHTEPQAKTGSPGGMLVLELRYPKDSWKNKCWFMPEKGWTLHRFEVFNAAGEIVNACQAEEYQDAGGIFIPKRGQRKHYLKGGRLGETVAFELSFAETRANRIPDTLFQFDFPKDSQIWDKDRKVFVRNADITESHLNEVVAQARPRNILREWLGLALFALVLAIGTYLLIKSVRGRVRRAVAIQARQPGSAHGGAQ